MADGLGCVGSRRQHEGIGKERRKNQEVQSEDSPEYIHYASLTFEKRGLRPAHVGKTEILQRS